MPPVVYAVGDVHGCADELVGLVERIAAHARGLRVARPVVVFLGDYVDRGPDSARVLGLLSSPALGELFDSVFLMGNHDLQMLRAWGGQLTAMELQRWLADWGGAETVKSYGVDTAYRAVPELMADFRAAVPRRQLEFLTALKLSHRIGGLYFCHAGIDPDVPLDNQPDVTLLYGSRRFLRYRGDFGARIVHGHYAARDVEILSNRINVNSSAGYPHGRLSAVAIAGPDIEVIAVP